MIGSLQRFVETLRARGVAVSPSEAIDAARASAAVGPESRARLRAALAMTLAKDLRSQALFEEAFDRFFAAPARTRAGGPGGADPGGAGGAGAAGAGASSAEQARPRRSEDPPEGRGRSPRGARALERRRPGLRALSPEEAREQLRRTRLERPRRDPLGRAPLRARDGASKSSIARPGHATRQDASANRPEAERRGRHPGEEVSRRRRLPRLVAGDRPPLAAHAAILTRRDLTLPMTTEEERRLSREVPRLLERLRLRRGRRLRRAAHGRLWMKRAIRENLATQGVPFRTPLRLPRRKRSRIVLLVDVSLSVSRAAGFFLMLALEFLRQESRTRAFVFIDHPADATEALRRWLAGPAPVFPKRRSDLSEGAAAPPGDGKARLRGPVRAEGTPAQRGYREVIVSRPASASRSHDPGGEASTWASRRQRGSAEAGGPARTNQRAQQRAGIVPPGGAPQALSGRLASPRIAGSPRARSAAGGIVPPAGGGSFRDLVASLPTLDPNAPSDYGRAFYALSSGALRAPAREALLVVLGDGRSNFFDPLPWAFEEIASRVRRVVWLVPEPRARWGTGDSALGSFLPSCDVVVEALDLEGLAHGVREIAASL